MGVPPVLALRFYHFFNISCIKRWSIGFGRDIERDWPILALLSFSLMKVISFLLANIGRVHVLNQKIEAFYDLWSTIYQKVAPLLPQHVAATAAVAAAVQEEPAQPAVPEPEAAQESAAE
jgi:hypothetical protein